MFNLLREDPLFAWETLENPNNSFPLHSKNPHFYNIGILIQLMEMLLILHKYNNNNHNNNNESKN